MARSTAILTLVAIALLLLIAAGGYLIVPGNPVFWCGRVEAYPGLYLIVAAALIQAALYVAGVASFYRLTQYLAAPFVIAAGVRIAWAYPVTAAALGLLACAIAVIFLALRSRFGTHDLAARIALSIAALVGLTAALTQIQLFGSHQVLTNHFLAGCLAAAFVIVVWAVGQAPPTGDEATPFSLRCLPLTLLLLPLLRARIADTAFDSFLYKATQPYQMAEWRTGRPAIMDALMVGTNFQEVINTDLLILLRDYTPPLLSTISYLLLFLIIPYAIKTGFAPGRIARGTTALAGLSIFVLPAAAIDQGTAYQEPTMLLMLSASLAPTLVWPAFLAMAAGVKISGAFVAPLIVFLHGTRRRRFPNRWRPILIGMLLGLLVITPQFTRNLSLTGRWFGLNETLAAITDPPGPLQRMVPGVTRYDGGVRGGTANNTLLSACNMFMLGTLCPTAYQGSENNGFMVFPGSRAPLFAAVLALLLAATRPRSLRSAALFLLCYWLTVTYMSEGRYFLPLSFGFAVFLLINRRSLATLLTQPDRGIWWPSLLVVTAVIMVGSDLVPGVFTNSGWACQRSFHGPVQAQRFTTLATPVEKFAASYVAQYKQFCPAPGLSPVILAEPDKLNSPYLGAEVVSHLYAQEMNRRFYAADPARQQRLATAALLAVYQHDAARTAMLGPAQKEFTTCFQSDGMTVLCSRVLRPQGQSCAQSLFPQP